MITPTVLLLTGVGFFSLILFGEPLTPLLAQAGMTPLLAAVYVGALQNIFSKSAKYSLFDPCKEMAYIPLDEEMKVWITLLLSLFMFVPKLKFCQYYLISLASKVRFLTFGKIASG